MVSITGSSYEVNRIGNLFGVILNIVENGKSVIPTLVANTSASVKVTNTPFQLCSFTSVQRDTLVAQNGYLIYNTTTNKIQGYANGSWVDLH